MASTITVSKGLRLTNELWDAIKELAKKDRRRTNEYISLVLEDHVSKKKKGGK